MQGGKISAPVRLENPHEQMAETPSTCSQSETSGDHSPKLSSQSSIPFNFILEDLGQGKCIPIFHVHHNPVKHKPSKFTARASNFKNVQSVSAQ